MVSQSLPSPAIHAASKPRPISHNPKYTWLSLHQVTGHSCCTVASGGNPHEELVPSHPSPVLHHPTCATSSCCLPLCTSLYQTCPMLQASSIPVSHNTAVPILFWTIRLIFVLMICFRRGLPQLRAKRDCGTRSWCRAFGTPRLFRGTGTADKSDGFFPPCTVPFSTGHSACVSIQRAQQKRP